MIGRLGSNEIKINKITNNNQGRILVVDANIDETFVLIMVVVKRRRNNSEKQPCFGN